jgi:hypothetical protein
LKRVQQLRDHGEIFHNKLAVSRPNICTFVVQCGLC